MKYFFEILLKQNTGLDHLEIAVCTTVYLCNTQFSLYNEPKIVQFINLRIFVFFLQWSLNRDNGIFSVIASEFLSLYEGTFVQKL